MKTTGTTGTTFAETGMVDSPWTVIEKLRSHPLMHIQPGDIIWTWCSRSMDREDKLYTGYSLICLHCHPELDVRRGNDDDAARTPVTD